MSYISDQLAGGRTIAAAGQETTIAVAVQEAPAVARAVLDLATDLAKVCDCKTRTVAEADDARIVVGTIGVNPVVDAAITNGDLDVDPLRLPDQTWRWEGYLIQTVGATLYIVGTDRRGTIFGVYDLCEAIGVSPWWWFADVPIRRRGHVTVRSGTLACDYPSIRYRGIFINDEEQLEAWAAAHTTDGTIGPQTYARVFELILRLKGNYIWPAMHVNHFNGDPANGRLAHEMGVVVGTSHCDMLLRSNQNEWEPWLAAQGGEHVEYDYSVPGRNRRKLHEYWRGSIQQNRQYEVSWTLGMRGIHDTGFVTSAIDTDDSLTPHDKHQARVALLGQAIKDQRALLDEVLDTDRATGSLKTFVPYKEVLPLYDAGLDVPDDVTIIWADDNFGYIRRYPSSKERERRGGHGLYYHSSYWSQPPRSYLFIGSTPLAHMKHELRKAHERGIRTLWVNNIGAIKPLEQETEFFLRYAWEVGKETTTADVTAFTTNWIDRSFSGNHGARAARIYNAFAQITNQRKIEHLGSRVFSQTAYGDEGIRRLTRLRGLYDQTNEIRAALPEAEHDAFFQLFMLRIHASYLVNAQFYYADRSTLAYEQGKLPAADHYLAVSRQFDDHKRAMIRFYNTVMSYGKWDGILTPETFPPPTTALFPAGRPALRLRTPRLGVVVWGEHLPGDNPRLTFSPHGIPTKWIEVFSTGAGSVEFSISADDWIKVAEDHGQVTVERRIEVSVPDTGAASDLGHLVIRCPTDGRTITVEVLVERAADPPSGHACHVEADGYISFSAGDADERHVTTTSRWAEIRHLGRDENSLMEARGSNPVDNDRAWLGYHLDLTSSGAFLLELHRFPSLDSTGRIRLGISVDDLPPVLLESPTTDEWRGSWPQTVLDNVEKLYLRLPYLDPGHHELRVYAIDDDVAFSKIVIYTARRLDSNLGPRTWALPADPDPLEVDLETVRAIRRHLYRVEPADVPLPPVVYVDRHYWDHDTTFTRNVTVNQPALAPPRHLPGPDGRKDLLAGLADGPILERNGVIALEAERTLLNTADAYLTPSLDPPGVSWTHTQAETDGGTGLAMHVDAVGRRWDDPSQAPGMHQRIRVSAGGVYHIWMLVKYDSRDDDACVVALDGTPQPPSAQFSGGDLYSFGTQQIWVWNHLTDLTIPAGVHTFSVLARKARLRIDRIYLTSGDQRPPTDASWPAAQALPERTKP